MSVLFEDFDFRRAQTFVEAEDGEEGIADDCDESEGSGEGKSEEGDDLYIIPMTNIKFDDDDE